MASSSTSTSSGEPHASARSLPEFVREKVERGRRLLAEDARYRGSADLQVRGGRRRRRCRRPPCRLP